MFHSFELYCKYCQSEYNKAISSLKRMGNFFITFTPAVLRSHKDYRENQDILSLLPQARLFEMQIGDPLTRSLYLC
jgi:hypothetical protein